MKKNDIPLSHFTGFVVFRFSFASSFCHPVRGDAKILWKGMNLAKNQFILGLELYCTCEQTVPLPSQSDTVNIHPLR